MDIPRLQPPRLADPIRSTPALEEIGKTILFPALDKPKLGSPVSADESAPVARAGAEPEVDDAAGFHRFSSSVRDQSPRFAPPVCRGPPRWRRLVPSARHAGRRNTASCVGPRRRPDRSILVDADWRARPPFAPLDRAPIDTPTCETPGEALAELARAWSTGYVDAINPRCAAPTGRRQGRSRPARSPALADPPERWPRTRKWLEESPALAAARTPRSIPTPV